MDDKEKERYVRWQNYRIEQFSFTINLFLGFAAASLAFALDKWLDTVGAHNYFHLYSIYLWSASAAAGSFASVFRLLDFRFTAQKIKSPNRFNSRIIKVLGPISWSLFWIQLSTYAVGSYYFVFKYVLVPPN